MFLARTSKSLAVLCTSLFFLAACAHSSSNLKAPLPNAQLSPGAVEKTVARVNDAEITATELKRAEKILAANKPGLQIPPFLQKEFELQVLNQMIGAELLFQASQQLVINDLDQQAEAKLAEIKKGFPEADGYANGLVRIGLDEKMMYDSTRRDLAIAYLVSSKIANDITVSEEEIEKFYQQNPANFHQEEQVRAGHILIGVAAKAGAEEKKAARDKAEKLHKELVDGADFAKLARENSICPSSKQGGDLGFFGKGKLDAQFEQAAFALESGALSGVVETPYGYHIIKLVERKQAEEIPLSQARTKVEEYLRAQKTNAAVEVFVGEARKSARIEVLL